MIVMHSLSWGGVICSYHLWSLVSVHWVLCVSTLQNTFSLGKHKKGSYPWLWTTWNFMPYNIRKHFVLWFSFISCWSLMSVYLWETNMHLTSKIRLTYNNQILWYLWILNVSQKLMTVDVSQIMLITYILAISQHSVAINWFTASHVWLQNWVQRTVRLLWCQCSY